MKANINQIKAINKKYNIFTSIRNNATPPDNSPFAPLGNLTYAIKDNFTTRNEPTTCSSKMLSSYISPFESTVSTLLDQSGSSCIGKTNMDEFAMGNSTISGYFGPTLNPLYEQDKELIESYDEVNFFTKESVSEDDGEIISTDIIYDNTKDDNLSSHSYLRPKLYSDTFDRISEEQRIVGGSSGGSAAAVALGLVDYSIGSDTGGSVRLPACYTNIYGFKPTYGRISRWGLVAYAQSLDTVGIMSKDLDILWKVFMSLDLSDSKDPSCLSDSTRELIAVERLNSKKNVGRKFKVGIPTEFLFKEMDENIKKSWKSLLNKLKESKLIEIYPISIPSIQYTLPTYYTLCTSEASSNLSRYDGIRYGYRINDDEIKEEEPEFITTRNNGFGSEVRRRIILGNYALSSYGFNSHFLKATGVRGMLIDEFNDVFRDRHCLIEKRQLKSTNGVDMIIVPTTTTSKPPLVKDFKNTDSVVSYMNDICTIPMSLAGLPTISVPYGEDSTGFQLIGQHGQDYKVLEFARLVEDVLTK